MIRVVKLIFKEEHIDDFKTLFNARKEQIKNSDGCSLLQLWQDHENPAIFYTYSLWSAPHHLETYRLSELFRETWTTVKGWFAHEPFAFSANKITEV
jgi:quinol monooxygenase YgiN